MLAQQGFGLLLERLRRRVRQRFLVSKFRHERLQRVAACEPQHVARRRRQAGSSLCIGTAILNALGAAVTA
jgi:hypothetical protein